MRLVVRAVATVSLIAFGLAVAVAVASPASAHAELIGSSPRDGQRLATSPSQITLTFSERVTPVPDEFRILGDGGAVVQRPVPRVDGDRVIVPVQGALADGGYLLAWAVVSSDSHPISGALSFGVARAAPPPAAAPRSSADPAMTRLVEALGFVTYAGLALLCGSLVFAAWCLSSEQAPRTVKLLGLAGGAVAAAGSALGLWLYPPYATGAGISDLSSAGDLSLAEDAGVAIWMVLAAAIAITAATLFPQLTRSRWVSGLVVGALALTQARTGHAISMSHQTLAVSSYTVHVAAMSIWVGGVVVLVALLTRHDYAVSADEVRRFSALALICVAALVATGVAQSWWLLASWSQLLHTDYGRYLVAKLTLVAVILAAAAFSRRRVRRPDVQSLSPTIRVEAALQVAVLAVTSVLVMTAPPSKGDRTDRPAAVTVQLTLPTRDVIRAGVRPSRPGDNVVTLDATTAEGAPLRRVSSMEATLTLPAEDLGPIRARLHRTGPAAFTGPINLPTAGVWRLAVTIRLTPLQSYAVEKTLEVVP